MASEGAHLRKAESNQRFLDTISDEFADWLAIVAFYKGVHLVEAMFSREGRSSHSHAERNRRLKREHPEIWIQFRPLYDASRWFRYTDRVINPARIRSELVGHRLRGVEFMVRARLGLN